MTHSAPAAALRHYINGTWEEGTGSVLTSVNPARPGETVAHGPQASTEQLDRAVAAASAAARAWAGTPMHERGAILLRAAGILERDQERLGLELAREEGKTRAEAQGEVLRAAQILRYYGNEGDRSAGEVFSSPRRGERILVVRKPLGVVGVVTPFNFPIAIPAWKIAPALAYGNTVVWKPASTVPLLALRLAGALAEAGLPAGVLNLVIGPGSLGSALVEHPRLDGLTFTGSTGIGRRLAAAGAARGVPVQAEMGGKNAAVVLRDADLDLAAEQVLLGAFRSTGQKCTATSRLIVDGAVADYFLDRLRARLDAWVTGDPADDGVHMGPLINGAAADSVSAGVEAALAEGAELAYQGKAPGRADPDGGFFLPPTVLELPGDPAAGAANTAWREEFFGPVLSVRRAADAGQAFELANQSEFGLSAAVFTQDVTRVLDAVDSLDVGILHVNSESAGADPHVPFGGARKSGYGPKEQGGAAKEFFSHTTTVYLRGGNPG
ncbi:aldehyde dehydrogenase family protein [Arthrobacter sunyaminii]|uniref:Aldehyde dehydrogenase family protein n=1 Tax=Arthrobacter sunyaminii TaxID=2816859 RepID=A0A975S500_9MICC|nr:aldehyde dehydrogenase family protein [Arthrobacter sunyaminii]MBO0908787.1 aldehyde dehydrogenase family protein [Arthrobacter sunyaminii]QWQ35698.1 aldehyde dehydrogenase family protein [Arthrobacter sunyaminii]